MRITGKLPESDDRAKRILEDAEGYFAAARARHRAAILAEKKRKTGARHRLA